VGRGLPARESWRPVGCLATGIALIAVPTAFMRLTGGANIYEAITYTALGLLAISIGCGIVAFHIARRFMPSAPATVVGVLGGVAPILPMFGSASLNLLGPQLYVLMLATVNWWLRRGSPVARVFVALPASTGVVFLILWSTQ
jgi:hypothetical protein